MSEEKRLTSSHIEGIITVVLILGIVLIASNGCDENRSRNLDFIDAMQNPPEPPPGHAIGGWRRNLETGEVEPVIVRPCTDEEIEKEREWCRGEVFNCSFDVGAGTVTAVQCKHASVQIEPMLLRPERYMRRNQDSEINPCDSVSVLADIAQHCVFPQKEERR